MIIDSDDPKDLGNGTLSISLTEIENEDDKVTVNVSASFVSYADGKLLFDLSSLEDTSVTIQLEDQEGLTKDYTVNVTVSQKPEETSTI